MIIAVDGPAAAGKGTLARRLAAEFGFAYLDTGLLYRAVAARVLAAGADPGDEKAARAAALALAPGELGNPGLRTEAVGEAASKVAAIPAVRSALLDFQRRFARQPPAPAKGAVLDGRDIGTVVCPDAEVKLFVTASAETRAHRRWKELRERNPGADARQVAADLKARDARDAARAAAPLKPAKDAHLLDTTNLDIEAAFAAARAIVAARFASSVKSAKT
jgi:cytidylate kinase